MKNRFFQGTTKRFYSYFLTIIRNIARIDLNNADIIYMCI